VSTLLALACCREDVMGYEKRPDMGMCDYGYCDVEEQGGVLGAVPMTRSIARKPRGVRSARTATFGVSVRPADVRPARPTTIQMFVQSGRFWRGHPPVTLERLREGSYVSEFPPEMLGTYTFRDIPMGSQIKFKISGECNGAVYSRTTAPYTIRHESQRVIMPGASCPLRRKALPSFLRR
jgi:hypothetical protein